MKRLLRIAINSLFFSFMPILGWFLLGRTIDGNLINVFSITYPLQFIYAIIVSIFGTGANIKKEKDNDDNSVLSGLILGMIVAGIIFGLLAIFVDPFVSFMNMDVEIYREFTRYSIISLCIHTIFGMLLEKYYFENKEKRANLHCAIYNIINTSILVITSLITKNVKIVIALPLVFIGVYCLTLLALNLKKFKLKFDIWKNIKYESSNIVTLFLHFIVFLFGNSNAFSYGEEYVKAINFVALVTDTQWDAFVAIDTVAKIDLAKDGKAFNARTHIKNAYILDAVLMTSSLALFFGLFSFNGITLKIALVFLAWEMFNFILNPIYSLAIDFLQLEYSPFIATLNKSIAYALRAGLIFLPTPYCLVIGGFAESVFMTVSNLIVFFRNYKLEKSGMISKRNALKKDDEVIE